MNIASLLLNQMQKRPEALAVRHAGGDLTYGEFGAQVLQTACGLDALGVASGDVVGVDLVDPLKHWLAFLALAHRGAIGISIAPTAAVAQLDRLFAETRVGALLLDRPEKSLQMADKCRIVHWSEVASHTGTRSDLPAVNSPDQPWLYVTGSGSTGRPKIMPVTHAQQLARASLGPECLPYGSDDIITSLVAMHFQSAKHRALEAIAIGAGFYLNTPGQIDHRAEVARGEITAMFATPHHLECLLRILPQQDGPHYAHLRALMVGSATVSMNLRERIRNRLTPNLHVLWGTNEHNISTITDPASVFSRPGTVGRLFPGIRLEIVDQQDRPVPAGVQGLVRVSGPTLIDGYLNDGEATRKVFRDGWFYPGDRGYLTVDNQLIHLGRADDMMNIGGVNLSPAEIEECLLRMGGVADAVALPLRHEPTQSDIPVALVVAEPGAKLDRKTLINKVRAEVAPCALHDVRLVDRIPRNDQGKAQREQINQILQETWLRTGATNAHGAAQPLTAQGDEAPISFLFSLPPGADLAKLKPWLDLLDKSLAQDVTPGPLVQVPASHRQWLGYALALTRGLLNAIGVPLFDPIEILDCREASAPGGRPEAFCRIPEASLVSRAMVEGVIKVSFKLAAWCVNADAAADADRQKFFAFIIKEVFKAFEKERPSGKSTFEILRVAHELGIAYRKLPGGPYQLGWGHFARRIDRSTTDRDSALGSGWTRNKLLTAAMLREAGLPAPAHSRAATVADAEAIAVRLGFPVVVKPADCERGEGVSVDITADRLQAAFDEAVRLSPSKTVLVERQVAGVCHRIFVVRDELLYAVKRLPMGVYADGRSSISALIAKELAAQSLLPPWKRSGLRAPDELAARMLAANGWALDSVPPAGTFVALRRIETTAWGGVDEDVTAVVHPDNVKAAIAARQLLGLEVAGVDIITKDITKPWYETGAIINEVNYAPLLGGGEISRRHIGRYLDYILENRGRIPVHAVVGGPEAWVTAQSQWKRLRAAGVSAYLTSDRQTFDGSGGACPIPGEGLRRKLEALRLRHDVEALVVVVQSISGLKDVQIIDQFNSFAVVGPDPLGVLHNPQYLRQEAIARLVQQAAARCSPPSQAI